MIDYKSQSKVRFVPQHILLELEIHFYIELRLKYQNLSGLAYNVWEVIKVLFLTDVTQKDSSRNKVRLFCLNLMAVVVVGCVLRTNYAPERCVGRTLLHLHRADTSRSTPLQNLLT